MTIISAAILLFMVMDPFGNIPFFLCVLDDVPAERRQKILIRELLIAFLILFMFLFFGSSFLSILHVTEPSLRIAGGIILFMIAIKMVFGQMRELLKETSEGEPFIVPLAIPSIAGPSAMATLMLLVGQEPTRRPEWVLSLLLAWGCSAIILMLSDKISHILGKKGLSAIERLMGLVLTTISVEMFIQGIRAVIKM
jgi:multiple antibiotic resistance protein